MKKIGGIAGKLVEKNGDQNIMKVKQNSVVIGHPCPWHGQNEEGKVYDSKGILPQGICPWLYHSLYPYFLGLFYNAKFAYNEMGDCNVCCPAAKGIDLVVKRRRNDGNIHPDVDKHWDFVIFADVVKVHEDCPANHKVGDRFIFPTVMKKEFMCTAGFNHVFPLLDLERPKCLDKQAVRCPDWNNPVFFDVESK